MNSIMVPSRRQLLDAVVKLSAVEYDALVCAAAARRAGVKLPAKTTRVAELLQRVRTKPARGLMKRMQQLRALARARELTAAEVRELADAVHLLESLSADRVRWVLELAGLRRSTFAATWKALGLDQPAVRFV